MTEGPTTARSYDRPQVVTQNPPRYESPVKKISSPRVIRASQPPVVYHSPHRSYISPVVTSPGQVAYIGAPQIINHAQSPRRVFTTTSTLQATIPPTGGLTNVRAYTTNNNGQPQPMQPQQPQQPQQPVYSPQR
jgi:hypothetical protein